MCLGQWIFAAGGVKMKNKLTDKEYINILQTIAIVLLSIIAVLTLTVVVLHFVTASSYSNISIEDWPSWVKWLQGVNNV